MNVESPCGRLAAQSSSVQRVPVTASPIVRADSLNARPAAEEGVERHQGFFAFQLVVAALPRQIPEAAVVPVAHHTVRAARAGSVSTLLGLPVVEPFDILECRQHVYQVFQEFGLTLI